jgi:hypothetical protein
MYLFSIEKISQTLSGFQVNNVNSTMLSDQFTVMISHRLHSFDKTYIPFASGFIIILSQGLNFAESILMYSLLEATRERASDIALSMKSSRFSFRTLSNSNSLFLTLASAFSQITSRSIIL